MSENKTQNKKITVSEKFLTIIAHIGGLLGFVGIIVPVLVLIFNKKDKFDRVEAIDAINFQITFLIASLVILFLVYVLKIVFFAPFFSLIWIINIILCAVASISIWQGKAYRYPFEINFIKNVKK